MLFVRLKKRSRNSSKKNLGFVVGVKGGIIVKYSEEQYIPHFYFSNEGSLWVVQVYFRIFVSSYLAHAR